MRKIALILAVVILFSFFASCEKEPGGQNGRPGSTSGNVSFSDVPESTEANPTPAPPARPTEPVGRVSVTPDKTPMGFKLEELGKIEDGIRLNIKYDSITMSYLEGDVGAMFPLNGTGEKLTDEVCVDSELIYPGFYAVAKYTEDVNRWALFSEEGEQLIPFEAALIETLEPRWAMHNEPDYIRYLRVVYATEETQDEANAVFHDNDAWFYENEKDAYYLGYTRLYDLVEKRFVPEFKTEIADRYCLDVGGSLFCVDVDGNAHIFNSDGKEIAKTNGEYYALANDCFLLNKEMYNRDGKILTAFDSHVSIIFGSGRFVTTPLSDQPEILDIYGNKLFTLPANTYVTQERGGIFGTYGDDTRLYDMEGHVLYHAPGIGNPHYEDYGIWMINFFGGDGTPVCYFTDGTVIETELLSSNYLCNLFSDKKELKPWRAIDTVVTAKSRFMPGSALGVAVDIASEGNVLYDAFTGEALLTAEDIDVTKAGFVYARDSLGGPVTVYKLAPIF